MITFQLGLLWLIGLLALSCAPTVLAAPEWSWEPLFTYDGTRWVILASLTGTTMAALNAYAKRFTSSRRDPTWEEHDENFWGQMLQRLNTMSLSVNLDDFKHLSAADACRTTFAKDRISTRALDAEETETALRTIFSCIYAIHREHENLKQLAHVIEEKQKDFEAAEAREDQVTKALTDTADQIKQWEDAAKILDHGNTLSPQQAGQKVRDLLRKSDLSPLINLYAPSYVASKMLSSTPSSIAQDLQEQFTYIEQALLSIYPAEKLGKFKGLNELVKEIQKYAAKASDRMSGIITGDQGQSYSPSLVLSLWDEFPESWKKLYGKPADFSALREQLRDLADSKDTDPEPHDCKHPEELAAVLGRDVNTDWEDSLAIVATLNNDPVRHSRLLMDRLIGLQDPRRRDTMDTSVTHESLFRNTEIPEFSEPSQYVPWKLEVQRFLSGMEYTGQNIRLALNRIMSRCTKDIALLVDTFVTTDFVKADWNLSLQSFFGTMDQAYLPPNFYEITTAKWRSLRARITDDPQEFMRKFARYRMEHDMAREHVGQPKMDDSHVLEQLLAVLPAPIRRSAYQQHHDLSTQNLVTATQNLIWHWTYANEAHQGAKPAPGKAADPIARNQRDTSDPHGPRPLPAECNDHIDREGCPRHLKGRLGEWNSAARLQKVSELAELNRCIRCRGRMRQTSSLTPPPPETPRPARAALPEPRVEEIE